MRCRKFCIRNGVANGSNIYNVVFDEYFKQRLKRYKPWMQPEIGQISTWFRGGTCFRWDLSRSACGRRDKTIHRIESTGSCIWSYVDQSERQATAFYSQARRQASLSNWPTGGEVVEFTMLDAGKSDNIQQGPSINTDVMTDVSSPEAAVDVVDSHCKSDQSKYQILTLLIHNLNLVNI